MEHFGEQIHSEKISEFDIRVLNCRQVRDASCTYGVLEPTMLTQMAKYLDTVYVSGWQCSSTASSTDEPSPDLADYPMVCYGSSNHRW